MPFSNQMGGFTLLFAKPSMNQLITFSVELTVVIFIITILFFLGLEIGRGIIIGEPLSNSIKEFVSSLPAIVKYHSAFKLVFLVFMIVSLILVFNSLSFSNLAQHTNPLSSAVNILIAITLLLLLIELLVLTNYPTFKILSGYRDIKGLIAYTFSLPSIIFSILFMLYFGLIVFLPKILQIALIFLSFFVIWVFYHLAKITEKYYCAK